MKMILKEIPKFLKDNKEYYKRTLVSLLFYSLLGMGIFLICLAWGEAFKIDINNLTNDKFPYIVIASMIVGVNLMRLCE